MKLTFAFCTYNRADRLENLVAAMRAQACPMPFEILAVNNNSKDDTLTVLQKLAALPGVPLRYVTEAAQGIVPARNRAIEEASNSDILVFIDDDELPYPGLLDAVCNAILHEGADCVGGPIRVDFRGAGRPAWLDDEIAGFLGEVNHGGKCLWVEDGNTPVWCGNIAYRMDYLRQHHLEFDVRYNRKGVSATDFGGGEDLVMLKNLLELKAKIRYRPDMVVDHDVEPARLKRSYFLRLHYLAGVRKGIHELPDYPNKFFGIPPFLVVQALRHSLKAIFMMATHQRGRVRQAMNAAHAFGLVRGVLVRAAG